MDILPQTPPSAAERELLEIRASIRGRPFLQAVVKQAMTDLPKLHAADQNQLVKVVKGLMAVEG